jgi:tetratricopeptide (TPR) repeat protein
MAEALQAAAGWIRRARSRPATAPVDELYVERAEGNLALASSEFERAHELLRRAHRLYPEDGETAYLMWCCTPGGRDPAAAVLDEALRLEPRLVALVIDRCHCWYELGVKGDADAWREAILFLDKVFADPTSPAGRDQRVDALRVAIAAGAGCTRAAHDCATQMREAAPSQFADALSMVHETAEALFEAGTRERAAALFRMVHGLDPSNFKAIWNELVCSKRLQPPPLRRIEKLAAQFLRSAGGRGDQADNVAIARADLDATKTYQKESAERNWHGAFVAYAHADHVEVTRVVFALPGRPHPLRLFMDQSSLTPGLPWRPKLEQAIREGCDAFVFFHSSFGAKSPYVMAERDVAFEHFSAGQDEGRVLVVDMDGSYEPRGGERVIRFESPTQVAGRVVAHVCALTRKPIRDTTIDSPPVFSVDLVGVPEQRRVAAALTWAFDQHQITVVRDATIGDSLETLSRAPLLADVTVCLVDRVSGAEKRWQSAALALFERRRTSPEPVFVPLMLDDTELPEAWRHVHGMDLTRFPSFANMLWVLIAHLKRVHMGALEEPRLPPGLDVRGLMTADVRAKLTR